MNVNIECKTVVETTVYSHDGKLTTHPTDIGEWYVMRFVELLILVILLKKYHYQRVNIK